LINLDNALEVFLKESPLKYRGAEHMQCP